MNCALPHSVEDLYAGAPLSAARHPPLHLRRHLILPCRLSSHEMELAHELNYEYKLNRITIGVRIQTILRVTCTTFQFLFLQFIAYIDKTGSCKITPASLEFPFLISAH